MSDLKNKFMDMLFEDDPEAEIDEKAANERVSEQKHNDHNEKSTLRAKDILYRKPGSSPFINLNEPVKSEPKDNTNDTDDFERSSQLSPIFGVIKQNDDDKVEHAVNDSQVKRPSNSYLDIITSPIYGYGNREDDNIEDSDDEISIDNILNMDDEDEQLHHLFDENQIENTNNNDISSDDLKEEEISLFKLFGENK